MLARTPDENGAYIGRDMSGSPLFRTMDQRPDAGAYYFKSPLDGQERLSFYRKSGRYVATRIGLDERILYASPSCARILGWDPARLLGTSALAGVNPEDRPRVEQVVAALKAGDAEEARNLSGASPREKRAVGRDGAAGHPLVGDPPD